MDNPTVHSFHIPVLGLGYSVDTPVKVARFGISSVMSIVDDQLIEKMRGYYCLQQGKPYLPILEEEDDSRARRITAYLNLVQEMVQEQVEHLRAMPFHGENDLMKYFQLLPEGTPLKESFLAMQQLPEGKEKRKIQEDLRASLVVGDLDVNIMVKVDKMNSDADGNPLSSEYSDALAALRGFAKSNLNASVVLSAGYNPRLYSYIDQFDDFFPDANGQLKKKVILKVSDYRSALVQGKILAKKGIWISEFRVESGLNCGGHAFATDGLLLGPILEEFTEKKEALAAELSGLCSAVYAARGIAGFPQQPVPKITVQGGIGTANEHAFLLEHYAVNATGWGSPFLLVPEATNVDEVTLHELSVARQEDYFMSDASPLGVPFNNFRRSSSEMQRKERIVKNRPGSPCHKKFLVSNTEFTDTPICTGSRQYQHLKLKALEGKELTAAEKQAALDAVTDKDCLCEGLGAATLLKANVPLSHNLSAVTICPGPNLAYFSGIFSLAEMVGHIYGRLNLLNSLPRPNMFINELHLYIKYFKEKLETGTSLSAKQEKYLQTFKSNLLEGIQYYKSRLSLFKKESSQYIANMKEDLEKAALLLTAGTSFAEAQPMLIPSYPEHAGPRLPVS